MTPRVAGLRMAIRFALHRRAQVAVVLTLGMLFAAAVVGLASARDSAEQAIADSLRADMGHRSFALQTGNADAIAAVNGLSDAAPVQDEQGDVSVGDQSVPVLVRATTDPSLRLGVLVQGEWPHQPGDVVVSESVTTALNIGPGDSVRLRAGPIHTRARVVGLSVDPANKRARTAAFLLPTGSQEFVASRWLRDADFYDAPGLRTFLDRRTATYQSLDSLLAGAAQHRPHFISALRFVPVGVGLVLGVVFFAAISVFGQRWARDVDTLVASGMSPAAAWRHLVTLITGSVIVGEIVGMGAVMAGLQHYRDPVSSWFGQDWVSVAVPWREALAVLAITVVAALAVLPLVRLILWAAGRLVEPARQKRRIVTPVAVSLGSVAAIMWLITVRSALSPQSEGAPALIPLATVMAAAVPFSIAPALGWGTPAASRSLVLHLLTGMRPVAAAAAVAVLTTSTWAAQTTAEANAGEAASSPLEPPGSFVISAIPDSAIPTLQRTYAGHGGERLVTYAIPDESVARLRVSSPELVTCMAEAKAPSPSMLPDTCFPQQSLAPVNTVMIGRSGTAPVADPSLIEEGSVGLLLFRGSDGRATRLADTAARPDPVLGGNLPGLVVPPDGDVAHEFDLVPGGTSTAVLLDFSTLTPHEQLRMRSAVARLAPGAQTADGTDPTAYDRLRSVANTVSFLGAAGAAVIVLLGGLTMVVAHTFVRRTILDLGTAPHRRWNLISRWIALPTLSTCAALVLAYMTASLGGQRTAVPFGTLWILPGAAALASAVVVVAAFLRTPPEVSD